MLASGRGVAAAAGGCLFALAAGVIAARAMVRALPCVPFTSDDEGEQPVELGNLLAIGMALAAAGAGHALAAPLLRWGLTAVTALAALHLLRRR
jgi:hypothetical protein